jgi:hypothetical protein
MAFRLSVEKEYQYAIVVLGSEAVLLLSAKMP